MAGDPLTYLARNVAAWEARRDDQVRVARRGWSASVPSWGIYGVAESVVGALPQQMEGVRTLELGCGTGYVSAWLVRRGAVVVALDPSAGQLSIAREFQNELGPRFPLVQGAGEQVPLKDGAFDLVVSEYGAAIWADPHRWIPEAARLLRPGGQLVFLGNSTLLMLCVPELEDEAATERLLRPQRGMHQFEWPDDDTTEFHLSHGDWIRLFRANRLEVEDLIEVYAPEGATGAHPFVTADWARQWPCEEIWRLRKTTS